MVHAGASGQQRTFVDLVAAAEQPGSEVGDAYIDFHAVARHAKGRGLRCWIVPRTFQGCSVFRVYVVFVQENM